MTSEGIKHQLIIRVIIRAKKQWSNEGDGKQSKKQGRSKGGNAGDAYWSCDRVMRDWRGKWHMSVYQWRWSRDAVGPLSQDKQSVPLPPPPPHPSPRPPIPRPPQHTDVSREWEVPYHPLPLCMTPPSLPPPTQHSGSLFGQHSVTADPWAPGSYSRA